MVINHIVKFRLIGTTVVSIKYYKLKKVVWSVVLWNDVHSKYVWWLVVQISERCCTLRTAGPAAWSVVVRNCRWTDQPFSEVPLIN
jgi:hypothetical protein